jgi:hypothetical protein
MWQSRDSLRHLNIVKPTHLLSHQKGLSSPDSSLRLLTRKEVQLILTERQRSLAASLRCSIEEWFTKFR